METNKVRRNILTMKGFYLFTFFGVGSLYPLLSVYLNEVEGLTGYQIGTIMSISPIMMIFFQPIWGMIADITNSPVKILTGTTLVAGVFSLGYLLNHAFYWFIIVAIMVALFQSAIIPISDSITLKYSNKVRVNYGSIRLFGSLGFGLAVFFMGRLSEIDETVIFYSFFISLTLSAILSSKLPKEKAMGQKQPLLAGIKEMLTFKKFIIFLVITFLIFGPNLANNTYFGLFVEEQGGTYTGIGIAFLIAVLSEIPFMKLAGAWIHRLGLLQVATIAGVISLLRWFFYYTEPSLPIVYLTAIMQGLSVGLFIPAGLQYIRDITPVQMTATAVTIYSAIGNGFGNWFSTFFGGFFYDQGGIKMVYLFFSVLALIGVVLSIWLIKIEKEDPSKHKVLARN
ncbi:major facilitator superfamily domain-containing protein 6 [Bacillus sp. T3]|uniref:MFS transporter n=1 Tax=Bacillus sp. T3 TaxID=467262 RepID=UPI0029819540|nr:major facilitator superfamily domain-containing protein 6 [Bacillus sp. T3]